MAFRFEGEFFIFWGVANYEIQNRF